MTNSNLHPVFKEILDSQLSMYSVSDSALIAEFMGIKEKALELIGKYQKHVMLKDFGGMDFEIARGCAMIGLDEMLDHIEVPSHIYQWFKQVRIELERVEQPCA